MERFIAYYRVSTQEQGRSGLGLAAQRQAVADYLKRTGGELLGEFEEVESGKQADRPQLADAIARTYLTGARLLIAKLDRLSRDMHFLTGLERQGVRFVACDLPDANEMTVHIMGVVAEQERKAISSRTSAALHAIKAKLAAGEQHVSRRSGKPVERLGNPEGLKAPRPDLGTDAVIRQANERASRLAPVILPLKAQGLSLREIAARLTEMRVQTPRGSDVWTAMGVSRVIGRMDVKSAVPFTASPSRPI